jgi:hypothetical protein
MFRKFISILLIPFFLVYSSLPTLAMNSEEDKDFKTTLQAAFADPEDFSTINHTFVPRSPKEIEPQSYTRSILRTGWNGFTTIVYYVWLLIRPPAKV